MISQKPPTHVPARQHPLSSLGWIAQAPPSRSSVELAADSAWTVARLWNTDAVLNARPLRPGTTRIVVGVDGAARLHTKEGAFSLTPRQMVLMDGAEPVRTENHGIWARCEWQLRSPALRQERHAAHFSRPLTLRSESYALITTMTNAVSTHPDITLSNGSDVLLEAFSGLIRAALLATTGHSMSLSDTADRLLRQANDLIEERHLDPSFDVVALATALHVSARYLRRVFAATGVTPRSAIEARRVRAASALLSSTGTRSKGTLEAVSRQSGFSTAARMRAALQRERGTTT